MDIETRFMISIVIIEISILVWVALYRGINHLRTLRLRSEAVEEKLDILCGGGVEVIHCPHNGIVLVKSNEPAPVCAFYSGGVMKVGRFRHIRSSVRKKGLISSPTSIPRGRKVKKKAEQVELIMKLAEL